MSRLPGYTLADYPVKITPEIEQRLSSELSRMLSSLRAIPPPSPAVCAFGGGPIHCECMALGSRTLGPFESIDAFHRYLLIRAGTWDIPEDEDASLIHETIRRAHSKPRRLCLTHNDLGFHNVLVDQDLNITGIVDWETCAWMPDYWEMTKAIFISDQYDEGVWYTRVMTSVFQEYREELKAEWYILAHRRLYA